jgi:hypothetical protein
MESYNGYTNHATWSICLSLSNNHQAYKEALNYRKICRDQKVIPDAANLLVRTLMIQEIVMEIDPCSLKAVNWTEVADCINNL